MQIMIGTDLGGKGADGLLALASIAWLADFSSAAASHAALLELLVCKYVHFKTCHITECYFDICILSINA